MIDTGYELGLTYLDELVVHLANSRAGQVSAAVVHPGDSVPGYGSECWQDGLATVRVMSAFPVDPFPNPALVVQPGCSHEYAVLLEATVDRCYRLTEENEMPPLAVLDSQARDADSDAQAMLRAAVCAFGRRRVMPGPWLPRGPLGGIYGGSMQLTVQADLLCGCDEVLPLVDERVPPLEGDPRL